MKPAHLIRKPNKEVRTREYLELEEVELIIQVAKETKRYAVRNEAMILLMFRHAFRVGEISELKWEQIILRAKKLHVVRLKRGIPSTQPIGNDEIKLLKELKEQAKGDFVFFSERSDHLTTGAIRNLVKEWGKLAEIPFPIHPHMLRHSTGYDLANKSIDTRTIQEYLGHNNIQHTVKYTALSSAKFIGLFPESQQE